MSIKIYARIYNICELAYILIAPEDSRIWGLCTRFGRDLNWHDNLYEIGKLNIEIESFLMGLFISNEIISKNEINNLGFKERLDLEPCRSYNCDT